MWGLAKHKLRSIDMPVATHWHEPCLCPFVQWKRYIIGAIHHGRIYDLPLAATAALKEGKQHAHRKHHPSSGVVACKVSRRQRTLLATAEEVEGASESKVVCVVPGHLLKCGATLAEPGHAAVDQPGIRCAELLGANTQFLRHAWTERLDENIHAGSQPLESGQALGRLQVERNGALSTRNWIRLGFHRATAAHTRNGDDVSTEVSEHASRQGGRTNTLQLQNANSMERHGRRPRAPQAWEEGYTSGRPDNAKTLADT
mmetsp:Transcript_65706/g.140542  ORF Transcript_65706/g.140542 Transcript_65706/m.140542 type:complete len:258 (-) Transcript_65706:2-775(-)